MAGGGGSRGALKVGLLLDGPSVTTYVYDVMTWAQTQPGIDLSHLIIHTNPEAGGAKKIFAIMRRDGLGRFLSRAAFSVVARVERALLKAFPAYRDHTKTYDVSSWAGETLTLAPVVSASGLVYRFSDVDVARVRALDLDVLIRCGQGILKGEILTSAQHGILSFHHGDNRVNRGGPAGFWESYLGWPVTGYVIQKLTEELDGGPVLARGDVPTKISYQWNQAHLYAKANELMKRTLQKLAVGGALSGMQEAPTLYAGTLYRTPSFATTTAYVAKGTARLLGKTVQRAFGIRARWGISFVRTDWRGASLWKSTQVKNPKGRFWADPFLMERDGRQYCFVEDFVYDTGLGHITVLEVTDAGMVEVGAALKEPFHLSFPFIFEHDGTLYMCPETSTVRQIRLYRCIDFPATWELAHVVMEDVAAADSMFLEQAGRWWMMTNIDTSGVGDATNELSIFYADSPLSKTWTPHAGNPVIETALAARNGGLLYTEDGVCRVGQRQGFGHYGVGARVFKIITLTETAYEEREVATLTPDFRPGLTGAHHITSHGGITVVDHMSRERAS